MLWPSRSIGARAAPTSASSTVSRAPTPRSRCRICAMPDAAASTSSAAADFLVRPARPADVAAIVRLIHGLAEFEKLTHLVRVTPESLAPHLFGPRPVAEALVAERA